MNSYETVQVNRGNTVEEFACVNIANEISRPTHLPRRWSPQDAGAVRAAGRTCPPLARELALLLKNSYAFHLCKGFLYIFTYKGN
jgi:hypothetical protein